MIADAKLQERTTELVVHTFNMSDVEDPDMWAAESLHKWEHSDAGKWVMNNATEVPTWYRISCEYGWQYQIRAHLTPSKLTYYKLKFE